MPARRIEITVPEEMWAEIDAARGDEPRAAWIKRALRAELVRAKAPVLSPRTQPKRSTDVSVLQG